MKRQPPIEQHPRLAEIDQALRNGVPFRTIKDQFRVALSTLSRRLKVVTGTPQGASGSAPASTTGRSHVGPQGHLPASSAAPSSLSARQPQTNTVRNTPQQPDDVLFDVASMSFPWAPGEPRPDQSRALKLRAVQAQLGIAAVKAEIMALTGDFRRMRLSAAAFSRQLDVPPAIIPQWVAARDAQDLDLLLHTEAAARVSRDHADLSDAIAQINMKLAEPNLGMRVFAQLTQQKTRLIEQRAKMLDKHGLDHFAVDSRDAVTKSLHDSLIEMFTPLREAYEEQWAAEDAAGSPETGCTREPEPMEDAG